jgi:CRISPR/Cas system-associated protein Cas5 (RAMP superfamily)
MDWPHDPDSEEGSEGMRKYGHAILAKKVDESDFPLETSWYVDEFGDHPVRISFEQVVSVADIMEHVDETEFEDFPEFHKAVGKAMRENGYWFYELA